MDPQEQDDGLARRREQNRLAQRRFRCTFRLFLPKAVSDCILTFPTALSFHGAQHHVKSETRRCIGFWQSGCVLTTLRTNVGKRSQQKAATHEQERQQHSKPTRASRGQIIETPPATTHQPNRTLKPQPPTYGSDMEPFHLVTPSPSSDGTTDPILSLDPFHLPFGNLNYTTSRHPPSPHSRPRTNSTSTTSTASRTERAHSLASGMGGLLGDQGAVWDFTDLSALSPPPLTSSEGGYPGGEGLMTPSISLAGPAVDDVLPDSMAASTARSVFTPPAPPSYQDSFDNNNPLLMTPVLGSSSSSSNLDRRGSQQQQQQQQPVVAMMALFDDIDARRRTSRRRPSNNNNNNNNNNNTPRAQNTNKHLASQQRPQPSSPFSTRQKSSPLGADPDPDPDPDEDWLGPLHLAASKGHDRIVRMLLHQHHQPVNDPDSQGQTALMHAVQGGFEDVVRSLLDAGATVDGVADRRGRTALHWAVLKRRKTLLRHLLQNGSGMNVDGYDDEGQTPLHRAIDDGFEAGVEVLLEFGANLTCRTKTNKGLHKTGSRERERNGRVT